MPYLHAVDNLDYSDYASGRVFYNAPKQPVLPVRLNSEIFQRCQAIRNERDQTGNVTIYDPCCGSAYHLATLGHLHGEQIGTILASDIDDNVLEIARKNLSLLTATGMAQRIQQIDSMITEYDKPSHRDALVSANVFRDQLEKRKSQIEVSVFSADALNPTVLKSSLPQQSIDIILADVPYGGLSEWVVNPTENALEALLNSLHNIASPQTILAIITNKAQKCRHEAFRRLAQFQIGKRRVTFLQHA